MSQTPFDELSSEGYVLAPSLLSADLLNVQTEIRSVEEAGAHLHHIDVMDGHFVPQLTFGSAMVAALKKVVQRPLDVHLMVSHPEAVLDDYIAAGADFVSFHLEATCHSHRLLQRIKEQGVGAGVALNPGTPVQMVFPLLDELDYVLLMSVNPGWGGQSFLPLTIGKCQHLLQELRCRGLENRVLIEVDGGIHPGTLPAMMQAGARVFVAGSAVYGKKDRKKALQDLSTACRESSEQVGE